MILLLLTWLNSYICELVALSLCLWHRAVCVSCTPFIKNQLVLTEVSLQAEALLNETPNFYCLVPNVLWLQNTVRISMTSETFVPLNYPLFGCVCFNSRLCYTYFHLFSTAPNLSWLCYANTFFGFQSWLVLFFFYLGLLVSLEGKIFWLILNLPNSIGALQDNF